MKLRQLFISIVAATATLGLYAKKSASVEDIAPYVFPANRPATPPSFTYAPDGNGYLLLSDDHRTIDRYDLRTGQKIETVFDASHTRETELTDIEGFIVSPEGSKILVYRDSQPIYRRSSTAQYYVYEVRTRLLRPLSREHTRQQSPLISPDGRMVAFVVDNNIYIKKLDYDSEVAVTSDGAKGKIINGVPDWVYEEEFTTNIAMTWAPDNLNLCYLRFDETDVPLYTLPIYEGTCNRLDQYALYPGVYSYKYPVAGERNSKVTVHSYDIETRKIKQIPLPDSKIEYIPRIEYGCSPERLMISALNRDQTRFDIYCANPKSTVVKAVYTDESKAWIEECAYEGVRYLPEGFVVQSSRSGYNHLYQYSYAGVPERTITSGNFDVTADYGSDAKGNYYYQAALPTPMDRTIYRIDRKGAVTAVSKVGGTTNAEFTADMSLAKFSYSDVSTPPVYTINTPDGKQVRVLEDNAAYRSRYADLPKKEFFTFDSEGYTLNGYIIRPSESLSSRRPVIMYQYSGPGSQSVLNKWAMDWDYYAAKHGYIVVCVDGRGTGGRGREFMDLVYKQLGYYETIDQINAAKYVASMTQADPDRIGICGWSYGGYETLMAASQTTSPYAAAVAIAPVTDWRYYDSVYTERYMLTPQQNEDGYRKSSAINRAAFLCCPLLIMYGTADDNVHPANSLQYVSTLQSGGTLCDMLVFPNMNHSINGCNARAVVYAKMIDFFDSKLKR